jgi:hypothetical protein
LLFDMHEGGVLHETDRQTDRQTRRCHLAEIYAVPLTKCASLLG